jgi:RND family efflux transporter MFP subunit
LKVAGAREDAARKSIEAAEKRRDLLDVRKADLEVRAPFPGRVVARHTERGEWLREGDPVVTLLSTGELEAWLQLPERQAASLKETIPESVLLHLPGRSEPIRATDLALIPEVEGRSRRFVLVARIPDPDHELTPGTSVRAEVPLGAPTRRLVVSSDAILRSYAGSYVMIPQPSAAGPPLAKRVPVTLLFERGGEAILGPGELKAGDQVIVEGNERLFPNAPVDPHPVKPVKGGPQSPREAADRSPESNGASKTPAPSS